MALSKQQLDKFAKDGILVVENFLTDGEVLDMKNSILKLISDMDPKEHRGIFSTDNHQQVNILPRRLRQVLIFHSNITLSTTIS